MKISQYYDEFFNHNYNRDFRIFGMHKKIKHAPKNESSTSKRRSQMQRFININLKGRYNRFYCAHSYFPDMIDYQLANDAGRVVNHFFFDFDKPFHTRFKMITNQQQEAMDDLRGKQLTSRLDELQEQIQDLIIYENILVESWKESEKVYEYFKSQGLRVYPVFSGSKGVHLRCFFQPIIVNNYNEIVHTLHKNLTEQFNLNTLDEKVSGGDSNPLKSVERLPYSFNEKSGLRAIPFSFETDDLNSVIDRALKLSAKNKLTSLEEFNLSEYVNSDFHNGILKLDSQIAELVKQEEQKKKELIQAKGTVSGNYTNGDGLFQDLRVLVRFVCGEDNLVSEHARYDKYRCVFHDDKNPSAIVGPKNYTCLSDNCKAGKLNYFEFLRLWFDLDSDAEVKEKMKELQKLYDKKVIP